MTTIMAETFRAHADALALSYVELADLLSTRMRRSGLLSTRMRRSGTRVTVFTSANLPSGPSMLASAKRVRGHRADIAGAVYGNTGKGMRLAALNGQRGDSIAPAARWYCESNNARNVVR